MNTVVLVSDPCMMIKIQGAICDKGIPAAT